MHLSTKDELKLRQQKKANQYICRAVETPLKKIMALTPPLSDN